METKGLMDAAEHLLRKHNCRITSFLSSSGTQYVVKKDHINVSPSFLSLREVCSGIVQFPTNLDRNV